jgi:hypothetical protein
MDTLKTTPVIPIIQPVSADLAAMGYVAATATTTVAVEPLEVLPTDGYQSNNAPLVRREIPQGSAPYLLATHTEPLSLESIWAFQDFLKHKQSPDARIGLATLHLSSPGIIEVHFPANVFLMSAARYFGELCQTAESYSIAHNSFFRVEPRFDGKVPDPVHSDEILHGAKLSAIVNAIISEPANAHAVATLASRLSRTTGRGANALLFAEYAYAVDPENPEAILARADAHMMMTKAMIKRAKAQPSHDLFKIANAAVIYHLGIVKDSIRRL